MEPDVTPMHTEVREVALRVSAAEAGEKFANADNFQQKDFLLAMASAATKFPWAMQCRSITTWMTNEERDEVLRPLTSLVEHLQERK